jgi:deoxyribose-phosphate aldolase
VTPTDRTPTDRTPTDRTPTADPAAQLGPLTGDLAGATADAASLREFLSTLPAPPAFVAAPGSPATRERIDLAVSMVDLTTLEATDTPGRVRALAALGARPDPEDASAPTVAALCVYPDLVAVAVAALADLGATASIGVASVAGAFPSGRSPRPVRLAETEHALRAGATEIDMVIDRGAMLDGRLDRVLGDIVAVRDLCGRDRDRVRLKVILETGELATPAVIWQACWIALLGGADFLKTSTGKTSPAATPESTALLLAAVAAWHARTGRHRGVKPAGGIRSAADALAYLDLVEAVAGPAWLTPALFRFGASSLLGALVTARAALPA